MRISERWLREWVDPAVSSAELAEQLTMAGLEVDGLGSAAPYFDQVVVGRIMVLEPHPGADRLRVAQVDVGQSGSVQIVCGAPNVTVGICAPTALVGAVLPGGLRIAETELRGVVSSGMLCSAKELGLAENAEGLLALPEDSIPGQDIRDLLDLDDQIIDVDLTPNRGDCLGMVGIAREVGVLNRCEVKPVAAGPVAPVLDAGFPVNLSAPEDCPRYAGRVIRDVDPAAPTPLWMTERLRRAGLRSLGPLVDVTNYVMLELGQPMHAFDLSRLSGGIDVRRARPGETLELLNDQRVELDEDMLLIADESGPLAMAGVMGGAASAVGDSTRDVFLESAFFAPLAIAGRARRFGLHTDSSHRFERGVDPRLQATAVERATRLLIDIAGGRPGPVIDVMALEHLPAETAIRLRPQRVEQLLGVKIEAAEMSEILRRLGMAVAEENDHWIVVPPSFRFDLTIEVDLIEEIGRVHGYSRLPSNRPLTRMAVPALPEDQVAPDRFRDVLVLREFQEAVTYSFVDPALQAQLDPQREPRRLANPISSELAVMRTSLWPGLLQALIYNRKRQQGRVRLFETGLTFVPDGDDLRQETYIGGVICGEAWAQQWGTPRREVDFYDVKADVEALLALTGQAEIFDFVAARHPALHPGQSARIDHGGTEVGWVGALHPRVEKALDLDARAFLFELSLPRIQQARVPRFAELSKFPASRRDIAVVVRENITVQSVEACIRANGSEYLRELRLFDVYRGKGVAEDHKSLAFGLILQDFSSNLTDEGVDRIVANIVTGLGEALGATLRV
jgi:phenylalanyl-tRNA synthetase beta chain